jgi:hypothetical protein
MSEPISGVNSCVTPSSARPSSALRRCFDFIGSFVRTRRRISGAKFGMPANCTLPLSDSASPTRSWPWFGMPITSPPNASSAISRSCAMNIIGDVMPSCLPATVFRRMPRWNLPDTMRKNAMRSRWLGSMFAWILNTKPVTSLFSAPTGYRDCPSPWPSARAARRLLPDRIQQFLHAEMAQRRSEHHRRHMAFAIALVVEGLAHARAPSRPLVKLALLIVSSSRRSDPCPTRSVLNSTEPSCATLRRW